MNKYLVLHPCAKNLGLGQRSMEHPKAYPRFEEFVRLFKEKYPEILVYTIGVEGDCPIHDTIAFWGKNLKEVKDFCSNAITCVCVDSFLPHLLAPSKKKLIVLWGFSSPDCFGYSHNINLFADKSFFRQNQWSIWQGVKADNKIWVSPKTILETFQSIYP